LNHAYKRFERESSERPAAVEEEEEEWDENAPDYRSYKTYEFSYILFFTLVRTAVVQQLTMAEPSTVTRALRTDCLAAIPAAKRALEMYLAKDENCGDCM